MSRKIAITLIVLSLLTVSIYADITKTGLDIAQQLHTDIKVFINNNQIPAMNINGNIAVNTQDLLNYGFDVLWNGDERTVCIKRNYTKKIEKTDFKDNENLKIGTVIGTAKSSDIKTYVVTDTFVKYIPSYNINGNTAILLSDLGNFGIINWDNVLRILKLDLAENIDDNLPVKFMNDSKIGNFGKEELLSIYGVNIFLNKNTRKIENDKKNFIIGLKSGEGKIVSASYENDDTKIFLARIIESIEGYPDYGFNSRVYEGYDWKVETNHGYTEKIPYKINTHYDKYINSILLDSYLNEVIHYEEKIIQASVEQLEKDLKNNKNIPLKIVSSYVENNSIGTPEATIIVQNLTIKVINAFELSFQCYDTYDRPVKRLFSGGNIMNGIAQEENIESGAETSCTWNLTLYDLTTKIKNVKITSVHFTDGTTWRAK